MNIVPVPFSYYIWVLPAFVSCLLIFMLMFRSLLWLFTHPRLRKPFVASYQFLFQRHITKKSAQQARYALPAFMDTLAMLLTAGFPLTSALQKLLQQVPAESFNALHVEMRMVLQRARHGESFAESMLQLRKRLPGPEMAMFVSLLVQSNRYGGRLAELLNSQAELGRLKIAEEFESKAQEAPVRLLLPLILFIFPATLLPFIGVIIGKVMWGN
ncbi:MAG: type II secretion system F family protein [Idiomarina sp.]|nr:type II secretion system F family protein [Idiomarina sp.]